MPEKCTVAGKVVKASNGEPLRKATVMLGSGRARSWTVRTDAAGHFLLTDIDPGQYTLSAGCLGYVPQTYSQRQPLPGSVGLRLTLDAGEHIRDIVFELVATAVITGRVLDEDGDPVQAAQVQALRPLPIGGREWIPAASAVPNDLGEYRLFGLAPGSYRIHATDTQSAFHPFPASEPEGATSVEVSAGEEVRGIDLRLTPTRTLRVRGRAVFASEGGLAACAMGPLMLQREGSIRSLSSSHLFTDDQGRFEVRLPTPGGYSITAELHIAGKRFHSREPLRVADSDVDDVEIVFTPGLDLGGRIRVQGEAQLRFADLQLNAQPRDRPALNTGARAGPDGSFLFQGIAPGHYTIGADSTVPSDLYLEFARLGPDEVLETGFDLDPGTAALRLELVFSSDGGKVEGVVLGDDSKPFGGAQVALLPDPPGAGRIGGVAMTDQNGRFTIRGVRPGNYQFLAWEFTHGPASFEKYEGPRTTCSVAPRSTQSVTFHLPSSEA